MKTLLLLLIASYCCPLFAQTGDTPIGVSVIGSSVIGVDSTARYGDTLGKADFATCLSPAFCFIPTILNFTGQRTSPASVALNWIIAADQYTKGFWLERSFSNAQSLITIAFVPGKMSNNALSDYSYTDANGSEKVTYYRLRLLNVNGAITYSKVIPVDGTPAPIELLLFPNPHTGSFVMRLPASASGGTAKVTIQNASGAVVFRNSYPTASRLLPIRCPDNLPPGQYFIQVTLDNTVLQSKMLLIGK